MKLPAFRRGSAANVIAILALVVAVSSTTAYAATIITSAQIKNGTILPEDLHSGAVTNSKLGSSAVTNSKLASSAVTGTKVKNGSLTASDLAAGTIPGIKAYATDHTGPTIIGASNTGVTSIYIPAAGDYLASAVVMINNGGAAEATVTCSLQGEGTSDVKTVYAEKSAENSPNRVVLALQLADHFDAPGQFVLACLHTGSTDVSANDARLSAIKVSQLQIQD